MCWNGLTLNPMKESLLGIQQGTRHIESITKELLLKKNLYILILMSASKPINLVDVDVDEDENISAGNINVNPSIEVNTHESKWHKDFSRDWQFMSGHPQDLIIGDASKDVLTRSKLDHEYATYAFISSIEPKNVNGGM